MAKVLTDEEMGQIIWDATHDSKGQIIGEQIPYCRFLEGLSALICEHFGGIPGGVGLPDYDLGYTVCFNINECVPPDGGVFKDYDTDVTWKDGKEEQE